VKAMEAIYKISSIIGIANNSGGFGGSAFYDKKKDSKNSRADFGLFFHEACDRVDNERKDRKDITKVLDAILHL
jgi:hypothetical protein